MRARLLFYWQELQSSYWFLPLLIILFAVVLAFSLVALDNTGYQPEGIARYLFSGSASSARTVLSTIAAAMISVAGTVFSMTLVALTLASSQFGSRLLRNFMDDRLNQVVLGTYAATFVYCLLVLNTVQDTDKLSFLPRISILFAIVLAVANVLLLIFFIHHIAVSIQSDKVIADIQESLLRDIEQLFPEDIHYEEEAITTSALARLKARHVYQFTIKSNRSAYLRSIDYKGLLSIAKEKGLLIEIHYRIGAFVVEHSPFLEVYSISEEEDALVKQLRLLFIFGVSRTSTQDPEFAIHQMVEIAARALSPGINDPYTAISCVDNLTSTICQLTRVRFPSKYRYDEDQAIRLITQPLSFEGVLSAAFNQIRQYAAANPAVLIRLMESLDTIYKMANTEDQRTALERHANMVQRAGKKHLEEENDLHDLQVRYDDMMSNKALYKNK